MSSVFPFGPFSTLFEAPWSGDVIQHIEPRINSDDISGVPEIERRVVTEVASYGRQLGWLTEAVLALAAGAGVDDPRIAKVAQLKTDVEAAKAAEAAALLADAEKALERLRRVDSGAFAKLMAAQGD
ncbi:hypothetical protein [Mesobacterium pallidum]|uniref:hypothetical protein n=1 Tax=Mesobacterium pallidum TaxID=2872037 RepID=UPI001EE3816F|nr:hypothetical protein [Mesobacterium pallidum]